MGMALRNSAVSIVTCVIVTWPADEFLGETKLSRSKAGLDQDIALKDAPSLYGHHARGLLPERWVVTHSLRGSRFLALTARSQDRPLRPAQGRFDPFAKASGTTAICAFRPKTRAASGRSMRKPPAGGTSPLQYPEGWPHTPKR
jgi:hypothetical protein